MLHVQSLSPAMGAEITGIDLRDELSPDDIRAVTEAFYEHIALFFTGQQLEPRHLSGFLAHFGEVMVYPYLPAVHGDPHVHELRKKPDVGTNFGGVWHNDAPFLDRPVKVNSLYSRQIPDSGGDTLFLNSYAAFDALSGAMKDMIRPLKIVHKVVNRYLSDVRVVNEGTRVEALEAVHPVVRVHSGSGREFLYLGGIFAQHFVGMTEEESRPLIDWLLQHVQRPEFQFRYHWQPDVFAIWDNRCCMHYAVNDYPGQTRVMHRALVREDA